jgi:hypothetical protein
MLICQLIYTHSDADGNKEQGIDDDWSSLNQTFAVDVPERETTIPV